MAPRLSQRAHLLESAIATFESFVRKGECVGVGVGACLLFSFLSFPSHFSVVIPLVLQNPFVAIMPVIQRTAMRAASRSALRARQNAAAFSSVARAAVNTSSTLRAAAPKVAVAAVKPSIQGKFYVHHATYFVHSESRAANTGFGRMLQRWEEERLAFLSV